MLNRSTIGDRARWARENNKTLAVSEAELIDIIEQHWTHRQGPLEHPPMWPYGRPTASSRLFGLEFVIDDEEAARQKREAATQ
jgi:hypothetical protein